MAAVFAAAIVCLAATSASAEGFKLGKAFGPDGTDGSSFTAAASVAVDQGQGLLYVLDRGGNALYKFDLEGNPIPFSGSSPAIEGNKIKGLPIVGHATERQVAVDSVTHTVYVTARESDTDVEISDSILAFESDGDPALFSAGPGVGTNQITIAGVDHRTFVQGVAVDSYGDIYVSSHEPAGPRQIGIFARSGAVISAEAFSEGFAQSNLAIGPEGSAYAVNFTGNAQRFTPSDYPPNPGTIFTAPIYLISATQSWGPRSVAVDPITGQVYVTVLKPSPRVLVFDKNGAQVNTLAGPGEAVGLQEPDGVAVADGGERVFVVDTPFEGGVSKVKLLREELCEGCAPALKGLLASNISGNLAQLRGRANPNDSETTYWFEYGTEPCDLGPCAKAPIAGAPAGHGHKFVPVSQTLTGLVPLTTYHYRLLAENGFGSTASDGKTFTTQASGLGFSLADSRVWEMVSPPDKHGGVLYLSGGGVIQAGEEGDGLTYLTLGSLEEAPEGNRAVEYSSVLARRGSGGSWLSEDITPPHTESTELPKGLEYKLFNSDLSRALMVSRDNTPLSPLTTRSTPYLRDNATPPTYTPLLTTAEGHETLPPGTQWSGGDIDIVGIDPDLDAVAIRSLVPLLPGAPQRALYMSRAGKLQVISDKGGELVEGMLGSGSGSVRGAVAAGGSRLFWAPGPGVYEGTVTLTALYLRDTDLEQSLRLDVPQTGASGGGPPRPAFQGANEEGTVVFFTDSRHLTKGASPEGRDLYRCEIPAGESLAGCATLTDISAPLKGSGESSMVKDQLLAFSKDGSRAYFVANGALDIQANKLGDVAVAGSPNLYFWEAGQGVRFIATLSKDDYITWGAWGGSFLGPGLVNAIAAAASPSGHYLAFVSVRSLTGYDNLDTSSGEEVLEVYRYDAVSGELICVSCNPTGGTPRSDVFASESYPKVEPQGFWEGRRVSALLPESRLEEGSETFNRPRTVLDNGRVFFNAYDNLVPADSNGGWDVYQYESTGTGSCTASSGGAAVVRLGDGCLALISSGTAEQEAAFLDADATGDNVFFLSAANLSPLDNDGVYDVYDARVNGVEAHLPGIAECQGEACRPAVSAPDDPTPSSAAFTGAGNITSQTAAGRCPKAKRAVQRHGRRKCVPRKSRKPPSKHRARHGRRAAR